MILILILKQRVLSERINWRGLRRLRFGVMILRYFPSEIKIDDVSIGKKFNYTNIQEPPGSVQPADTTRIPIPIKTFPASPGDENSRQVDIYRVVEIKGNYNTAKLYKVSGEDKINLPSVTADQGVWTQFFNLYEPIVDTKLITTTDNNETDIEIYYFVSILTMNNGNIDNLLYNNLTTHTLPDERTIRYHSVYSSKPILINETNIRKRNNKHTDSDLITKFGKVIKAVAPIARSELTTSLPPGAANLPENPDMVHDKNKLSLYDVDGVSANINSGGMDGGGKPRLSISSLRYLSNY